MTLPRSGIDNSPSILPGVHHPAFQITITLVAFCLALGAIQSFLPELLDKPRGFYIERMDWIPALVVKLVVVLCLLIIVTSVGSIRIGGSKARAEYSFGSWLGMLSAVGIVVGVFFLAVFEPLFYSLNEAPHVADELADSSLSRVTVETAHYWGWAGWTVYAFVGLAFAFYHFNLGLPCLPRTLLHPLLGHRASQLPGRCIDIATIVATMFMLTAVLGLGAVQIVAVFNNQLPDSSTCVLVLSAIVLLTGAAGCLLRSDSGVFIQRLAEITVLLAIALFFVVLVNSGADLVFKRQAGVLAQTISAYMPSSDKASAGAIKNVCAAAFYWSLWLMASPLVGIFIARLSKGRTIREFLVWTVLVPATICGLWMSTFIGAAINLVPIDFDAGFTTRIDATFFRFEYEQPLFSLITPILLILITVLFMVIVSAGARTVSTMVTQSDKSTRPGPVFWCVLQGGVATLILFTGGLSTIQYIVAFFGVVFSVGLVLLSGALLFTLYREFRQSDSTA